MRMSLDSCWGWVVAASMLAASCSTDTSTEEAFSTEEGQLPITPEEELIVLSFVNDAQTTFEVLDVDVALDKRAAENIIIHRDGYDETYPSGDDDPYDSIAELDSVPYVGNSALGKIRDYAVAATSSGPSAEVVEGVSFTADEAEAVIWGVNQASFEELDVDVALTSTAAGNLVSGAPYESVAQMGAVAYVGPSALKKLKSYAPVWADMMGTQSVAGSYDDVPFDEQEAQTALVIANEAYPEQLADGGITTSPKNIIVGGRPWESLAALADTSGIGQATMQALKNMVPTWGGAVGPPMDVGVQGLVDEIASQGEASSYYDQAVAVSRAIITTVPHVYSSGSVSFFVADPYAGNQQQLEVYVTAAANQDLAFASLFDDVQITGRFTKYYSTWEILVEHPEQHGLASNKPGLPYDDYAQLLDAWTSTVDNPEGAVLVESQFGYWYKVPLPLFKDHPMYEGLPDPGDPDSKYGGNDHPGQLWCGDQADILAAWLAEN